MTRIKLKGPSFSIEVETPEIVAKDNYSSSAPTLKELIRLTVEAYKEAIND